METNQKSLELVVAMDANELKFIIEPTKCFGKDNADLDTKLCSQANDLKESTKTIVCL